MKIINKLPILIGVEKIDEDSILLKFKEENYIGARDDVFALKIFGQSISKNIEMIEEEHLNDFTAVQDGVIELIFYRGNIKESPDWGDWMIVFSLPFEKYEAKFIE